MNYYYEKLQAKKTAQNWDCIEIIIGIKVIDDIPPGGSAELRKRSDKIAALKFDPRIYKDIKRNKSQM